MAAALKVKPTRALVDVENSSKVMRQKPLQQEQNVLQLLQDANQEVVL